MLKSILTFLVFILASTGAHASTGCDGKSAELTKLESEDQADRKGSYESVDWSKTNARDLQRRIRVAEIFAEGCFKTPADYAHAALIYQHGTVADHYYQAFVWANQAVRLGDTSQRSLVAIALDRYLVAIGQKELFGSQLSKDSSGKWCLQPVEPTFPESLRIEYRKMSIREQVRITLEFTKAAQSPDDVKDCPHDPALKPSPKGTVPGFW